MTAEHEPITWLHCTRGGYCFPVRVPAVFVRRAGETHALIDVLCVDGSFKRRRVKAENLRRPTAFERAMVSEATDRQKSQTPEPQ